MNNLSQRDPRWSNIKINNTNYTIGTDGCLITCLAMQANTTPDVVENKIGFTGAQVNWSGLENIGLQLIEKSNTYDNSKVSKYIEENGSCIVRVDWDGSPKSTGDTHFVLYIGNQQLIDPWTGTIKSTSSYPLVTGYRAVKNIGGNMPDALQECLKQHEKLVTEAGVKDEAIKALYKVVEEVEKKLSDEIQEHKKTATELDEAKQFIDQLQTQIHSYKQQIQELNNELENCSDSAVKEYIQVGDTKLRINGGQWNGGNYEVVERK